MDAINHPTLKQATNLLEMYRASLLELTQIVSPGQRTKITNDRLDEIEQCKNDLTYLWKSPKGRPSKFGKKDWKAGGYADANANEPNRVAERVGA